MKTPSRRTVTNPSLVLPRELFDRNVLIEDDLHSKVLFHRLSEEGNSCVSMLSGPPPLARAGTVFDIYPHPVSITRLQPDNLP